MAKRGRECKGSGKTTKRWKGLCGNLFSLLLESTLVFSTMDPPPPPTLSETALTVPHLYLSRTKGHFFNYSTDEHTASAPLPSHSFK